MSDRPPDSLPEQSSAGRPEGVPVEQPVQDALALNARRAIDRWYRGDTDDPAEALMYAENLLQALSRVEQELERLRLGNVDRARLPITTRRLVERAEQAEAEAARLREERDAPPDVSPEVWARSNRIIRDRAERTDEAEAECQRLRDGLRRVTQAEWGQVKNETPFQFEQRVHRIAADSLLVPRASAESGTGQASLGQTDRQDER